MVNIDKAELRKQLQYELARRSFWEFCKLMQPDFYKESRGYLREMCDLLQKFYESNGFVLVINVPARHGKSLTLQYYALWVFGKNPCEKIMTGSYNETLSTVFAKSVRNKIMETKVDPNITVYSDIFPETSIADGDAAQSLWALKGHYSSYLATSPKGTSTGFGASCVRCGTLVTTDKGLVPIEYLGATSEERKILTMNNDGALEFQDLVARSMKKTNENFWRIVTENGQTIETTPEHLFWEVNSGYKRADAIKTGELLLNEHLKYEKVIESHTTGEGNGEYVFDIQVSKNHNFFASGVLIHNCIIIDDVIKNAEEAYNDNVLNQHFDWFANTLLSRLEEGGKIIICSTRWSSKDLSGRVLEHFAELGKPPIHVNFKAIQKDGSMLCEEILSKESCEVKRKTMGEDIFMANYQQEPLDVQGRLYDHILTYDDVPRDIGDTPLFVGRRAYVDTADTGSDFLACVCFGVSDDKKLYILDTLCTKEPMEKTEDMVAKMLHENDIRVADIESNNGGRGFARNVDRILKEKYNNHTCVIKWFTQSHNKKARILSNSANVMNSVLFPKDWTIRWPEFAKQLLSYQKEGRNAHDDVPDCVTGAVEKSIVKPPIKINPQILRSNRTFG